MKLKKIKNLIIMTLFFIVTFAICSFARGWVNDGSDVYYIDDLGEMVKDTIKSSGDDKFYLDNEGYVARDYLLEDYDENIYYFDDNGKMVKNTWVAVDPYQVEFPMDNPPTIYLYYFGPSGKAFKAKNGIVRKVIDGKKYLFNENGQMLSGWIDVNGDRFNEYESTEDPFIGFDYYAGDETDGVLREGWMEFIDGSTDDRYYTKDSLWFYFRTNNNRKIYSSGNEYIKKKINGYTYAFDENGVMIEGWDSDMLKTLDDTHSYYSEEQKTIGVMSKKQWIFAVPSEIQNKDDHDQEIKRWFYSLSSGEIAKNCMKKINNKFFAFNEQGIMQKGLVVLDKATREYIDTVDLERTDCHDFIMSRYYISDNKKDINGVNDYAFFDDQTQILYYFNNTDESADDFGARNTGLVSIAFEDDDYQFKSVPMGQYEGKKKKIYYQAGIKLKADSNLGLGLVLLGFATGSEATSVSILPEYANSKHSFANYDVNHKLIVDGEEQSQYIKTDYIVDMYPTIASGSTADEAVYPICAIADSKGYQITKAYSTKKDRDGNYWVLGMNGNFVKIFEVPVKYVKRDACWYFKSEFKVGDRDKTKTDFRPFGEIDAYGKTCTMDKTKRSDYEVLVDEVYALNFRYVDK